MKLDKKIVAREALWRLNQERLAELAWRAIHVKKLDPQDFLIVCIDVDDPAWTDLVEALMPGHDWDVYRARGEAPIARGSVLRSTVGEYLAHVIPGVARKLRKPDDPGVQVMVLAAGGGSLYLVEPKEDAN
jgi:hypothetical protein